MKINVPTLKSKKTELNDEVANHKDIYTNFKNYLDMSDLYWDDPNSDDFFILTKLEQIRFEQTTSELKSLIQVYNLLISNYGKYGNNIFAELKAKNSIVDSFNNVIDAIRSVISSLNSIDTSLPEGASAKTKVSDLTALQDQTKGVKQKVIEILEDFIRTEKQVASSAAGIQPEIIKEDDIEIYRKSGLKYVGENYGMYFLDKEEIKKVLDYVNESNVKEQSIYNKFQETLSTINNDYISENTSILNSKCNIFKDKLFVLYKYHINDEHVINDCYNFYINVSEKSKKDIAKIIESSDLNGTNK